MPVASTTLSRGANVIVSAPAVRLTASWRSSVTVDVVALLLTADGKVRGDGDLVFYNQPNHPSGAVSLDISESATAGLTASLPDVEATVDKVVLAGSIDEGSFDQIERLRVDLVERVSGKHLARFEPRGLERVSALVFGELYRRQGQWKFRAIGQGWAGGLAALATHYGIEVADESAPEARPVHETAAPRRTTTRSKSRSTGAACAKCGTVQERKGLAAADSAECLECLRRKNRFLYDWRYRAKAVLNDAGPTGAAWDKLWTDLREHDISVPDGRQLFRPLGLSHLERLVTFAFADGVIEQSEIDEFETAVRALGILEPAVTRMRQRMRRGLELSQIRDGALPRVESTMTLEADEFVHLDVEARHVRFLAKGPRENQGRLVATNKKLRFVALSGGMELSWAKVLDVHAEAARVQVQTSSSKGGIYVLPEAEYTAAVLIGALRVAKRLRLDPTQRDTRSIPQHVKLQVWQRDGGACVQCGATEYLEFDHDLPHSLGGATSVTNLRLLCRRCNLAKGNRL